MDVTLSGLSSEVCLVYLDDVIIFSHTWTEHLERLEQVFPVHQMSWAPTGPAGSTIPQTHDDHRGHLS